MSKKLLTADFKVLLADYVYDAFTVDSGITHHLVGCRPEGFANTVPDPEDSVFGQHYDVHDNILFAKRIQPEDVKHMIRNVVWESGNEYDIYDDKDENLSTKDFYVVADQTDGTYSVFLCLYKADADTNPTVSVKPNKNQTAADEDVYITGDGYHWKYMFDISAVDYAKFATDGFVPVTEDVNVTANAVCGSVDAIIIESGGTGYNNYASGTIREVVSTTSFSLESDAFDRVITYDVVYDSANTFTEGDSIGITVPGANTVTVTAYKTGPSSVSFEISDDIDDITQSTVLSANSAITLVSNTASADTLRIREENIGKLSSIDDYYIGATFYIRSGDAAGETKTITDYQVTGNQKIVVVDSAFTTTPSLTSTFSITPKIVIGGDGSGASAIPIIDTTANSIIDIQILDRGSGYTYATASANGYSGDTVVQASLRPTIPPTGGHGFNVKDQLYATQIGISTTFNAEDARTDVTYSSIAVIKNLLMDNVVIEIDSQANSTFIVGETLTQLERKASGTITELSANSVYLTNVLGSFSATGNSVTTSSNTASIVSINKDTDAFDNTLDLTVSGTNIEDISVGDTITQDNTGTTAYVIENANTVLTVADVVGTFDLTNTFRNGEGPYGTISAISDKNIVDNSGNVIYIENFENITRSADTKETVKLIIKF